MAFDTMISLITAPLSPPKPFQLWPDPQEKGRGRRLDLCGISKVRIYFRQAPPPSLFCHVNGDNVEMGKR